MKLKLNFVLLSATFLLTACGDSRYLSEKLLWQTNQEVNKILKEKKGIIKNKDYEKIINKYKKITQVFPLEPVAVDVHFLISEMYLKLRKHQDAIKELKVIIQNFSAQPEIVAKTQFRIAQIYELQRDWTKALEEYDKVMDLYPMTVAALNTPIYLLTHYKLLKDDNKVDKTYQKGLRFYDSLLQDYKKTVFSTVINDYLAKLHRVKGNFDEAIKVLDETIKDYSGSKEAIKAFITKAQILAKDKKDIPQAIKVYQEFLELYPDTSLTPSVKIRMGSLYFKKGNITKAKNIFTSIIKEYPNRKDIKFKAYLGLTYCYRKETNTEKLLQYYNKIKEEFPNSKTALAIPFLIGRYYQEIKYNTKAYQAYKEAINEYKTILGSLKKNTQKVRDISNLLTISYIKNNELEKAVTLLRELSEKYQSPLYLLDLARLYRNLNANTKAKKVYEEILTKFNKNKYLIQLVKQAIASLDKKNK